MQFYDSHASRLRLATPSTISILLGAASAAVAGVARLFQFIIDGITSPILIAPEMIAQASYFFHTGVIAFVSLSIVLFVLAIIFNYSRSDAWRICHLVKQRLHLPENGNPLKLKSGERLPHVSCKSAENGKFYITIDTVSSTVADIQDIVDSISAGLKGKRFERFSVSTTDTDVAHGFVRFTVEDVTLPREINAMSVDDLLSGDPTKLRVQDGAFIDLTTSGSMLVAGKTRSGKTTAIISLLMQVLAYGRDKYGSKVTIIDPKRAELSQLPHVVTVDSDGEARSILNAVRDFADTITQRQAVLNDLSKQRGDAVKWWNAGMKQSFLFIDEYVALRAIFPAKASKGAPDYSLSDFDNLLKKIVTMRSSAGAFVILSVAEASVEQGGLPAMLRYAMSTRVLFRPTLPEARLMWDSEKLATMPQRVYNAGDCWFSTTDGEHDNVSIAHFPVMNFRVYAALGRLLRAYYN